MRGLSKSYAGLLVLLVTVSIVALIGCGGDVATAPSGEGSVSSGDSGASGGELKASLNGAGATFPEPLYLEWIGDFTENVETGVSINYQGIGSGGGIQQLTQLTVDFGASDAPMKDEEITAAEKAAGAKVLHIPTVFGAVVLSYNLEGVEGLKLDSDVLAAIFLGEITRWNDAKLAALNEGLELPDEAIQVVHRSDSSGTTNIFTGYLAQVSPSWKDQVGAGKEVDWPAGVGGQGNDGVAAVITQQPGSLGYVELSYALEADLAIASLKNRAGTFVEPTLESTSAAAEGVQFPADLRFSVSNSEGEQAYPIVGATWVLAYDKMSDAAKAEALRSFLTWALQDGDDLARELGYAPLPPDLEKLALEKIGVIGG